MKMNQCDKCGKVFPPGEYVQNMTKLEWEGRFQLSVLVRNIIESVESDLCPGCIKMAVADWQPKEGQ